MHNGHSTCRPRAIEIQYGVDEIMKIFAEDGCVVIKNVLSAEQVATMNAEIDIPMYKVQAGCPEADPYSQDFHGRNTKRMTNLVTHSKVFRSDILDHDVLHEICERVFRQESGDYWMNTAQVIDIGPGNAAQPLHRDVLQFPPFGTLGAKGPEGTINFFLALQPFTEENGATRCIPGSHKDADFWDVRTPHDTVPAEMDAGSIFLFSGKLIHGGGANRTQDFVRRGVAISIQCCYLTPEEAYPFHVSMDVVKTLSEWAQIMIGFRTMMPLHSGGLWQSGSPEVVHTFGS